MYAICKRKTKALSTLNKLLSPVSLVVLAMLHSSFVADSVSVNKEAETDALLDWKVSLQNETQPPRFHGLSLLIMQPINIYIYI